MRWDELFSDLDAQFEALANADLMAEMADRERVAVGAVTAVARISGSVGRQLRVRTTAGVVITGILAATGPDWLLVAEGPGRDALVALRSVTVVEGLTAATGAAPQGVALRLDLRHALRGLTRDRAPVSLFVCGGQGDSAATHTEITGTIDRVGADFVELAVHAPWEPRRAASVRSVVLVPTTAIVLVRALPLG